MIPEGQDHIRLTLAILQSLSADPIRLCLEGRAVIDGQEVVHPAVPAEEMTQAFFYKHVVPAGELIVVPEDRDRYREEAALAAKENKPFPPPMKQRWFQPPMEIQPDTGENTGWRDRRSAGSPRLESRWSDPGRAE